MCKVHKGATDFNNVPSFCPILSAIGTCIDNLATFFVQILKDCTANEYSVKDSFSFYKEMHQQDPNLHMASFDMQSLFTNIPLDKTINICVDLVF